MRVRRLDPIPYTLALGLIGTIAMGGPRPQSPPPAASAPSCPLPVGKQIQAVKAYAEMLPVFRHARCANCHGGMDVFSEQHPGAGQLDEELNPRDRLHDTQFREDFSAQCTDCHDGLAGWTVPPPGQFFIGRSDERLCMQMKMSNKTPELFVGHIFNDHGGIQFIAAGFKGDRAVGEEELTRLGLRVEPPPGTQADLTEKARRFVEILGERGFEDPKCGCVLPKVKLEIHHTSARVAPRGIPSREDTDEKFEVALEPLGDHRPGMYRGEHSLTREIKLTLPRHCSGRGSRTEAWEFQASLDTASGAVRVWRSLISDEEEGGIDCRLSRGTMHTGIFPGVTLDMLGFGELVLPADSGSTKTLTGKDQGYSESLTITVLELP